jgi:hypothetical protein
MGGRRILGLDGRWSLEWARDVLQHQPYKQLGTGSILKAEALRCTVYRDGTVTFALEGARCLRVASSAKPVS